MTQGFAPTLDLACTVCIDLRANGRRSTTGPIHCRDCHRSWGGNEAQHCTRCHQTFASIGAADHHRYRKQPSGVIEDCCEAVHHLSGWREKRPGVWTDAEPPSEDAIRAMRFVTRTKRGAA